MGIMAVAGWEIPELNGAFDLAGGFSSFDEKVTTVTIAMGATLW